MTVVTSSEVTVRMAGIDARKALRTVSSQRKCVLNTPCKLDNVTALACGGGARCAVGFQGTEEGVGNSVN